MGELDGDLLALRVCELNDLTERLLLSFIPETGIFRRDAALRDDGCGFYDSQARTAREDASNWGKNASNTRIISSKDGVNVR